MGKISCLMLVDDDEITNFLNESVIKDVDIADEVVSLSDCDSALSFFVERSMNRNAPEVILLDLNMPGKNGFHFLKEFKKLPSSKIRGTKVFILSSSTLRRDLTLALELGADGCLEKPLDEIKVKQFFTGGMSIES